MASTNQVANPPKGDTAQRPNDVTAGGIRYNTDTDLLEFYTQANTWVSLSGGAGQDNDARFWANTANLTANNALPKTGGTLSGNLFINAPGVTLYSSNNSGGYFGLYSANDSSARWLIGKSEAAESGSNAGSNLVVLRYGDTGGLLGTAISISRQTGIITLGGPLLINGGTLNVDAAIASTLATAVAAFATANAGGGAVTDLTARAWANTANLTANNTAITVASAFGVANSGASEAAIARGKANTACTQSDQAGTNANNAYGAANLAYLQANVAYLTANIANQTANSVAVTVASAYGAANSVAITAAAAFTKANTACTQSDQAGTNANNAYGFANTVNTTVASVFGFANNINLTVGAAFAQANLACTQSDVAGSKVSYGTVNTLANNITATSNAATLVIRGGNNIIITANTANGVLMIADDTRNEIAAFAQANLAYTQGNNAYNYANTLPATIATVYAASNTVLTTAQAAFGKANTACSQSDTAGTQANAAYAKANTAAANPTFLTVNTPANNLVATSNTDILTVRGGNDIIITGNTANDTLIITNDQTTQTAAFAQANSAASEASIGRGKANTACTQSDTAGTNANTAYTQGNNAYNFANTVLITAISAYNTANTGIPDSLARTWANTANLTANNALPKSGGTVSGALTVDNQLTVSGGSVTINRAGDGASAYLTVMADAGLYKALLVASTTSLPRWIIGGDSTAESGANVGTDFSVLAYDDTGVFREYTMRTRRDTGAMIIGTPTGSYKEDNSLNVEGDVYQAGRSIMAQANLAFAKANTACTQSDQAGTNANNAYGAANTTLVTAQGAFAQANGDLSLTGGTLTGDVAIVKSSAILTVNSTSGQATVSVSGSNGTSRTVIFNTNNSVRWGIAASVTENGSNTGSNFAINRYDDFGTFKDQPVVIARDTGVITMAGHAFIGGTNVAPTITAAFAQANTACTQSNQAGTNANNAYGFANTVNTTVAAAFSAANSAASEASIGRGKANTACTQSDQAGTNANNAYGFANTVNTTVAAAFSAANSALQNYKLLGITRVTANTTFSKDANTDALLIKMVGGGGGGGGAANGASSNNMVGSGGGSGAYIESFNTAPAAAYVVKIGAAGTGGTGGATGGDGVAGGNTSVSLSGINYWNALGGAAGSGSGAATVNIFVRNGGAGGAVGASMSGDLSMNGVPGGTCIKLNTSTRRAGDGGSGQLGSGGQGDSALASATGPSTGGTGSGYGSGGAGGLSSTTNGGAAGGPGAPGYVEFWEFRTGA